MQGSGSCAIRQGVVLRSDVESISGELHRDAHIPAEGTADGQDLSDLTPRSPVGRTSMLKDIDGSLLGLSIGIGDIRSDDEPVWSVEGKGEAESISATGIARDFGTLRPALGIVRASIAMSGWSVWEKVALAVSFSRAPAQVMASAGA